MCNPASRRRLTSFRAHKPKRRTKKGIYQTAKQGNLHLFIYLINEYVRRVIFKPGKLRLFLDMPSTKIHTRLPQCCARAPKPVINSGSKYHYKES
jgi:hypothetical protein